MLSVSELSAFLYCKRRLYIKRALGIKSPESRELFTERMLNKILVDANDCEKSLVISIKGPLSKEELLSKYRAEYMNLLKKTIKESREAVPKALLDSVMEEAHYRADSLHRFMNENSTFGNELWEGLTPKIQSGLRLSSDGLELKGIVDRVEFYNGMCIPYEIKFGSAPKEGIWQSHRIQLMAHMLLLKDNSHNVSNGFVKYVNGGAESLRKITLNPFFEIEIKTLINSINLVLSEKRLPKPCPNRNKCLNCGLKKECNTLK